MCIRHPQSCGRSIASRKRMTPWRKVVKVGLVRSSKRTKKMIIHSQALGKSTWKSWSHVSANTAQEVL